MDPKPDPGDESAAGSGQCKDTFDEEHLKPDPGDEPAAGSGQCREAFDEEHLEQLFATALRAASSSWVTMMEGPDVHVARSDVDKPFVWIRGTVEAEGVPADIITRFLATSPNRAFSHFIKSEEERAELRPADPADPDGLGRVIVHDQTAAYFGFQVVEQRLYATRRLPDGTGFSVRAPVDFLDGRWTTCNLDKKFMPTIAFRSEVTAAGSRFVMLSKTRPTVDFIPFVATSIICKIFARANMKFMLTLRRVHVPKWQAAAARSRWGAHSFLFASGSAAAPLHLSSPAFSSLADSLESPPLSPFALHSWSPPLPAAAPAGTSPPGADSSAAPVPPPAPPDPPTRDPNRLFYNLIGVEEPAVASLDSPELCCPSGGVYQMNSSQTIKTEKEYFETPSFRSVFSEAAQASLDLSIQMEALSLGVPPPSPPAAAAAPEEEAGPECGPQARPRARRRSEGEADPAEGPAAGQPQRQPKAGRRGRRPRPPPAPPRSPRPIRPSETIPPQFPLWLGGPGVPVLQPSAAGLPTGYLVTYGMVPVLMEPLAIVSPVDVAQDPGAT